MQRLRSRVALNEIHLRSTRLYRMRYYGVGGWFSHRERDLMGTIRNDRAYAT